MTKNFDEKLLEILACPLCKGDLIYDKNTNELICLISKLAFRIENGIPILLIDEARKIK
jgi:uncharacterized protein